MSETIERNAGKDKTSNSKNGRISKKNNSCFIKRSNNFAEIIKF